MSGWGFRTARMPTQPGSTHSQPDYITNRDQIDDSNLDKPRNIDQAGWFWEKHPGTQDKYYKCFYWFTLDMSPSKLLMHRPPCPGRAVSPPRSSASHTHPRTSARKCAPSSARIADPPSRIAEPLNPHVETTAKHPPPKPPPPRSERPDADSRSVGYRMDRQRIGHTASPEGRLDAGTTASHAPNTTAKSGQPRSTDLAESREPVAKRARNNTTDDPPDVHGTGSRMFGPNYPNYPVGPEMPPPPAVPPASEMPELAPVATASNQIRAKPITPVSGGVSSETRAAAFACATPASHMPPSAAPMIGPGDQPDADGEVHYPPWARKVLDEIALYADGIIPTPRGHEKDDPEDQCELASPTPRLLTAGGYNRQH